MNKKPFIKSTLLENVYLGCFAFLSLWFLLMQGYSPYIHGPDMFLILYGFICILMFLSGLVLALMAASDRKVMFVMLTAMALLSAGYLVWY